MEQWLNYWEFMLASDVKGFAGPLAAVALLTCIELLVPAEEGQSLKGRARNIVYLLLIRILGAGAVSLLYIYYIPQGMFAYEPSNLEAAALIFANLFAIDFLFYWYHRAQHKFHFLWAIHELHHSDSELNATTTYRTYWLELPIQTLIIVFPTVLLFGALGAQHAFAIYVGAHFFLIFSHSNIRLTLGPLTPVFCGPQVHRIHHSILPEHRDRNFAQYFPFIDKVFGTYYSPEKGEFPPTGAPDLPSNATFIQAMIQPFVIWSRSLKNVLGLSKTI